MLRVVRKRDPPGEAAAADRQILETGLDEGDDLVAPRLREDEFRVLAIVLEEGLAVLRQPEEVRLLLRPLDLVPLIGAASVDDLTFRIERLAGRAVPAFVRVLVDVPSRRDLLVQALGAAAMPVLRRPDEVVVADPERLPEGAEALDDLVGELQGQQALRLGGALDVLSVLVGAREEVHLLPGHAAEARDHVGDDGRVGVPDVRHVVHVVDRRRQVEVAAHHSRSQ